MSNLNDLTSLLLPLGRGLSADQSDSRLSLMLEGQPLIQLNLERDPELQLRLQERSSRPLGQALWAACYWLFARDPECQRLTWHLDERPDEALRSGLLITTPNTGQYLCERALFWKNLARFNRWQNSLRVMNFWQEGGSLEQHHEYLSKLEADPHALTLMGCFDDEPFAYFEAYWAKEDRIAPFYDAGDYDRGIHMLVGEENHRGPHKVASWLSALVHYLFLDDPRTQRVVAEPRADNARMISYMQNQCFHCEKEFDFPHKRAALMILGRERFFDRCALA